jgi:deoxyribodipyrimidine photolyase
MDDDGGPSYWWRDNRVQSLQRTFSEKVIQLYVQERLFKKIREVLDAD